MLSAARKPMRWAFGFDASPAATMRGLRRNGRAAYLLFKHAWPPVYGAIRFSRGAIEYEEMLMAASTMNDTAYTRARALNTSPPMRDAAPDAYARTIRDVGGDIARWPPYDAAIAARYFSREPAAALHRGSPAIRVLLPREFGRPRRFSAFDEI